MFGLTIRSLQHAFRQSTRNDKPPILPKRYLTPFLLIAWSVGPLIAQQDSFRPELFAFQTGFANADSKDPDYLVNLVRQSGFDGVELMGLPAVESFMPALRTGNLKLHSIYLKLDLDHDQPFDPNLLSLLQKYPGEIHYLWFHVHSDRFRRSDPAGDPRCTEVLRQLSDLVQPFNVKIGIYHHVGLWVERFSDGVRVARRVDRPNVGAVFNLCHYLKTVGPNNLENELSDAFPFVILVSVNGADNGDTISMGWNQLIQPLDQGTFDVRRVLRVLRDNDYRGPIGLQGFAIQQKPEEFFPNSVTRFRKMLTELGETNEIKVVPGRSP